MKTAATITEEIDEVKRLLTQLERDITMIKLQLGAARSRKLKTKVCADHDWYQSATKALAYKALEKQELQNKIATLKRERHEIDETVFPRNFIAAARFLLPKETYLSLVEAAKRKMENPQ